MPLRIAMVCSPIAEWYEGKLRPAYMDGYRINPHLGPYLLAAILDQEGFDISIVDLICLNTFDKRITEKLSEYDILIFSCNSTNWPTCRLLIEWMKDMNPNLTIILGGTHATLFGDDLIRHFPIDYLMRGEGEKALVSLLEAIGSGRGWENVPGLIFKKNGRIIKNPFPQLLSPQELDSLPVPLYSQMPENKYKTIAIESSRGCKGSCAFCAIPFKRSWRPISPHSFVDKIEMLQTYLDKVETKYFTVVDDCFTIDKNRVIAILGEVERRGITFRATYDARIQDFLDEELVSKLAPYSKGILLGAESFLPETLRRIGKPIFPKDIEACAKIIDRYSMSDDTIFSFIIGFPWESKNQIQENLRRIADLILNYGIRIYLQWHILTPGSAIWQSFFQQKKVLISDMDDIGYLTGKKWFNLSSSLSIEDMLEISDMVTCIQKVLSSTKIFGDNRRNIEFIIPPYLLKNQYLTKDWCDNYQQRMDRIF